MRIEESTLNSKIRISTRLNTPSRANPPSIIKSNDKLKTSTFFNSLFFKLNKKEKYKEEGEGEEVVEEIFSHRIDKKIEEKENLTEEEVAIERDPLKGKDFPKFNEINLKKKNRNKKVKFPIKSKSYLNNMKPLKQEKKEEIKNNKNRNFFSILEVISKKNNNNDIEKNVNTPIIKKNNNGFTYKKKKLHSISLASGIFVDMLKKKKKMKFKIEDFYPLIKLLAKIFLVLLIFFFVGNYENFTMTFINYFLIGSFFSLIFNFYFKYILLDSQYKKFIKSLGENLNVYKKKQLQIKKKIMVKFPNLKLFQYSCFLLTGAFSFPLNFMTLNSYNFLILLQFPGIINSLCFLFYLYLFNRTIIIENKRINSTRLTQKIDFIKGKFEFLISFFC